MAARTPRRLLVPVADNAESLRAVDVACRLAADTRAIVEVVSVIEVPALLPVDARMEEEEAEARRLLRRAEAIADSYRVGLTSRLVRARDASNAIVSEAEAAHADLIVIGAPRRRRVSRNAPVFGATVRSVLKHASSRVLLIAAAEEVGVNGNGRRARAEVAVG